MPRIYLDPSVDEFNEYVGGGNEELYMNLIVDAMIPYLEIAGIEVTRNNPSDTLNQIVEKSNSLGNDLHLSLRSTPSPSIQQGPIVYYNPTDPESQKAAYDMARNLWTIYPNSNLVDMVPNVTWAQISSINSPTVVLDLVNPTNLEDTEWLRDNIYRVARTLVFALTDYFQVPFNVKREPLPL